MVEVGEPFTMQETLSKESFITVFAPSGEKRKVTMVVAKAKTGDRFDFYDDFYVAPATGNESGVEQGTRGKSYLPPLGGNGTYGQDNAAGLQPVYITESDGLYIGWGSTVSDIDVIIQGVRIA